MIELLKKYLPRTIWDFFALQLRIALALALLVPFFSKWDDLIPGTGILLLFCVAPILGLIFTVDRKTLLWTLLLLVVTGFGCFVGVILDNLFFASTNGFYSFLCMSLFAIIFWLMAIKIKYGYNKSPKGESKGQIII